MLRPFQLFVSIPSFNFLFGKPSTVSSPKFWNYLKNVNINTRLHCPLPALPKTPSCHLSPPPHFQLATPTVVKNSGDERKFPERFWSRIIITVSGTVPLELAELERRPRTGPYYKPIVIWSQMYWREVALASYWKRKKPNFYLPSVIFCCCYRRTSYQLDEQMGFMVHFKLFSQSKSTNCINFLSLNKKPL